MAARTPLEDCRRSRKLDAEYNRTVIANLVAQRDALAEALRFCVKALEVEAPIYRAHIDEARAALAIVDGAK